MVLSVTKGLLISRYLFLKILQICCGSGFAERESAEPVRAHPALPLSPDPVSRRLLVYGLYGCALFSVTAPMSRS